MKDKIRTLNFEVYNRTALEVFQNKISFKDWFYKLDLHLAIGATVFIIIFMFSISMPLINVFGTIFFAQRVIL